MWHGFENGLMVSARCNGRMISEAEIISRLAVRTEQRTLQAGDVVRRNAAVLMPMLCQNGEWALLFTRRTEKVPHHKGQVSFPGGAYEPGDKNSVQTALRETCEEIGLRPEAVRILGELGGMPSVSNYMITPIVGRIIEPF